MLLIAHPRILATKLHILPECAGSAVLVMVDKGVVATPVLPGIHTNLFLVLIENQQLG